MKPHILLKEVPHVDSQPIRQAQKRLPLLLGKLRLCHRRSSLNLVVCCRAFPFRPASAQRYKIPPKSPIDVFRDSGSQRNSPYAPFGVLGLKYGKPIWQARGPSATIAAQSAQTVPIDSRTGVLATTAIAVRGTVQGPELSILHASSLSDHPGLVVGARRSAGPAAGLPAMETRGADLPIDDRFTAALPPGSRRDGARVLAGS